MRGSEIRWDCSTHRRPVNAECDECALVVKAIRGALPQMRAVKMRRLAAELILGFAAHQYGLAIVGVYGGMPELEVEARRQLHAAAQLFVSAAPPRRRR